VSKIASGRAIGSGGTQTGEFSGFWVRCSGLDFRV
jgi:hypothetical protein